MNPILSVDGGGVRGLVPAMVLARLETLVAERLATASAAPAPLHHHFDLMAGASTGAIIVAGLSALDPARDHRPFADPSALVDFYRNDARHIFGRPRRRGAFGLIGTRHDPRPLERRFAAVFGDARLSEAVVDLLVPAYDIERRRLVAFRGGPSARREGAPDYRMRDVLRATTAAPAYFPPARIGAIGSAETEVLIDGGIHANNPALAAYLEARRIHGIDADILLVSLGTGSETAPLAFRQTERWGIAGWFNPLRQLPLMNVIMHGQSMLTHDHLEALVSRPRRYFRLQVPLDRGAIAMDDASPASLARLAAVAERLIEAHAADLATIADLLAGAFLTRRRTVTPPDAPARGGGSCTGEPAGS